MRSWSGGLNAAKAQGRDWKAYAKKVTLRWVFKTVSEFAVQKRKEGPSTRRGPGDMEAAQEMARSW